MDTDMEIVTIQQETCFIFCSSPAPKLRLKDNASPLFIPNAKFALPLFFGNLLQQFYNLADTAIAGHVLGDHALAQIGAVSALYGLITNFNTSRNGFPLVISSTRLFSFVSIVIPAPLIFTQKPVPLFGICASAYFNHESMVFRINGYRIDTFLLLNGIDFTSFQFL